MIDCEIISENEGTTILVLLPSSQEAAVPLVYKKRFPYSEIFECRQTIFYLRYSDDYQRRTYILVI